MTKLSIDGWTSTAIYSPPSEVTGKQNYRYVLTREWQDGEGTVAFVCLNPSTATETVTDPTVRRMMGFARAWGYRKLTVLNLFALRSTDPGALYKSLDPVGVDNNANIERETNVSERVIVAWGNHGEYRCRGLVVLGHLLKAAIGQGIVYHLGMTGRTPPQPKHPLYLSMKTEPIQLEVERGTR